MPRVVVPKHVVSSTLDKVEWTGSRLLEGTVAEGVRRLRQEPGQDLLLAGSGQLFNALSRSATTSWRVGPSSPRHPRSAARPD